MICECSIHWSVTHAHDVIFAPGVGPADPEEPRLVAAEDAGRVRLVHAARVALVANLRAIVATDAQRHLCVCKTGACKRDVTVLNRGQNNVISRVCEHAVRMVLHLKEIYIVTFMSPWRHTS